jgi:RNA polymerase sigma-70 factor (ECF subfamily)
MPSADRPQSTTTSDPSQWVDEHGDALYRYAFLRTRDADLAEEMVQECLVAALGARASFAGQSSERTWLVGILKRKIIDHARRSARERPVEQPETLQPGESVEATFFDKAGLWKAKLASWGGDPRQLLENQEFWEVFRACLKALPSALAEAFLLRDMDRVESQEICEVLGLTPTNLWTRLHRARLALRACLESHWFGGREGKASGGNA